MNPGGIRSNLVYDQLSGGELPGQVTYGEAFSVQPFGNSLVTMTVNGTPIDALLEQQFDNPSRVVSAYCRSQRTLAMLGTKMPLQARRSISPT